VKRLLSRYWPLLLLLGLWQAWVSLAHVPAIVMPAPAAVAAELAAHPGFYLREGGTTLAVALAGLVAGVSASVVLAAGAWFSPYATAALTWPVLLIQATPIVALMPVVARVLGYDQRTVIASAALITLFPTLALVAAGLRALPRGSADVFAVLGAGRFARLRLLALPAAVPNLLTALRISSANCILAALVAEYLMGTSGLGRDFAVAESSFRLAEAWAACLVATALSTSAFLFSRRIEAYVGRIFRA
jgi:NitT/TauT family transport system permease protein